MERRRAASVQLAAISPRLGIEPQCLFCGFCVAFAASAFGCRYPVVRATAERRGRRSFAEAAKNSRKRMERRRAASVQLAAISPRLGIEPQCLFCGFCVAFAASAFGCRYPVVRATAERRGRRSFAEAAKNSRKRMERRRAASVQLAAISPRLGIEPQCLFCGFCVAFAASAFGCRYPVVRATAERRGRRSFAEAAKQQPEM